MRERRYWWPGVAGVVYHEMVIFRHNWHLMILPALAQPTVYLLAFGLGLGSYVPRLGEYAYLDFIATGMVVMTVLFTASDPAMYSSFDRRTRGTYDAMLVTPLDPKELVLGEAVAIALKSTLYSLAPTLVGLALGVRFGLGFLLIPVLAFMMSLGFAFTGIWFSAVLPVRTMFGYVNAAVLTPLFLAAGTVFPTDRLPAWVSGLNQANPLYHCTELVRDAAFGRLSPMSAVHMAVIAVFGGVMYVAAIRGLQRALRD